AAVAVWHHSGRRGGGAHRAGAGGDGPGVPPGLPGELRGGLSHPLCLLRRQRGAGARGVPPASALGEDPAPVPQSPEQEESRLKRMWMLALSLALVLCGCAPTAREPDQLALVRVLGVAGSGPVELTAVCGLD